MVTQYFLGFKPVVHIIFIVVLLKFISLSELLIQYYHHVNLFLYWLKNKYPDPEGQALGYPCKGILYFATHAMDTNPFSYAKKRESKKETKTKTKADHEHVHVHVF